MIEVSALRKAWLMLEKEERRSALWIFLIMLLSAVSAVLMVGSILPFLAVLGQPSRIQSTDGLRIAYEFGGFETDYGFLIALGLVSFIIIVFATSIQTLKAWAVSQFTAMRVHSFSTRLLSVYLSQPYEFFLNNHSSDLGTQILSEAQQAIQTFYLPALDVIAGVMASVAIAAFLIWLDPTVAIFAFVIIGGAYGLILAISKRMMAHLGKQRFESNVQRYKIASEALEGAKPIKVAGKENFYLKKFKVPSRLNSMALARINVISQIPSFTIQAVAFGAILLITLFLIDEEGLQAGAALGGLLPKIGVLAFAGQRVIPELQKVYNGLTKMRSGSAAIDALYRDLRELKHGGGINKTAARLSLKEALRLEDIKYSYPNANNSGVRAITLSICAGEKVGLVGGTGAGKTTLVDIILGLLKPNKGRVLIDGILVDDRNLRDWQQAIGYVPQDIFLTDSSVLENIAFGIPAHEIDRDQVEKVAQIANIYRFITEEMPNGFDTQVGERGVRLSGGQRQRLGIARALYHDADLIVFDEATSALDNQTESEVMQALAGLPGNKTVLMIAHRLATVRNCDRIVVMDAGEITGMGTWEELKSDNPTFRALVDAH